MLQPTDRQTLRSALAVRVCDLPYSRLLEWGLTRTSDLTGLDTIGLPVFSSCRPPGTVITVSAGKGMTKQEAKAGAILEGVELWAAENPDMNCYWTYSPEESISEIFKGMEILPLDQISLARSSPLNRYIPICWDIVDDVFRSNQIVVPSDLVWLKSRIPSPFQYFQTSSNGLAAGVNRMDATLQALYELVERDSWSISEYIQSEIGQWPKRVGFLGDLPEEIEICLNHLKEEGVYAYVFQLTSDIPVPVFGCTLLDPSDSSPGSFSGYGCSLNSSTAVRRAITESVQARAAYIGAARDDLFRRKFVLMKKQRSDKLVKLYNCLPESVNFLSVPSVEFGSIEEELGELVNRLRLFGISECYSKVLHQSEDPEFCIIRVICPQLSNPPWEHWQPSLRCKKAVKRVIEEAIR